MSRSASSLQPTVEASAPEPDSCDVLARASCVMISPVVDDDHDHDQGLGGARGSSIDCFLSLPPALIGLLVQASPLIDLLASVSLLVRWSHPQSPFSSWISIFAWSALCLFGPQAIRLGAPNLLIALTLLWRWLASRQLRRQVQSPVTPSVLDLNPNLNPNPNPNPNPLNPTSTANSPDSVLRTLASLQIILDHLQLIASHLHPLSPALSWSDPALSSRLLRVSLLSIPSYILLLRLVSLNALFAFSGSLFILSHSPSFRLLCRLVWQSSLLRFTVALLFHLFISPGPGLLATLNRGSHHRPSISIWPQIRSLLRQPSANLHQVIIHSPLTFWHPSESLTHRASLSLPP